MEISIRNYRAVESVDIVLDKITGLFGKNESGKTSTLDAIRSAATANPNPFNKEIPKKLQSMLVRSGTPSGFVEIRDGDNVARVDWPGDYTTKGTPVNISPIAAGLESLADMDVKERIKYIADITGAAPTKTDLANALIEEGIVSGTAESVQKTDLFKATWEKIDLNGWDVTFKAAKEKGAKLKGRWEEKTGANYGIRVAEQWLPENWTADLEKTDEETLIGEHNKAKEWRDAAIAETAVDEKSVKELTQKAANIKTIESTINVLKKSGVATEKEVDKKLKERTATEGKLNTVVFECPSCKDKLIVRNNKLVPASELKIDKDALKKELKKIDGDLKALNEQKLAIARDTGRREAELAEAKAAAKELENPIDDKSKIEANLQDTENRLQLAEDRLAAYRTYHAAKKLADDIVGNKKIQGILAPSGLRNKKLLKEFKVFNNSMKMLTDGVGWKPVEITDTGDIVVGGVPFGRLIAKSARYRVRVLLQLMVAMAEKAEFVIIDDADELTSTLRGQLFAAINLSTKRAIIVSALNDREEMKTPPIDGYNTYWIEAGKVVK